MLAIESIMTRIGKRWFQRFALTLVCLLGIFTLFPTAETQILTVFVVCVLELGILAKIILMIREFRRQNNSEHSWHETLHLQLSKDIGPHLSALVVTEARIVFGCIKFFKRPAS